MTYFEVPAIKCIPVSFVDPEGLFVDNAGKEFAGPAPQNMIEARQYDSMVSFHAFDANGRDVGGIKPLYILETAVATAYGGPIVRDSISVLALANGATSPRSSTIVGSDHNSLRPTQESVDPGRVRQYMDKLQNGETIKPIEAVRTSNGDYIIDGHHRYVAGQRLGQDVPVNYTPAGGPVGMPNWHEVKWEFFIRR